MYYKAKNVDTDKNLKAIEEARRIHGIRIEKEIYEKRAYLDGINKGLDIAKSIFECSNYEKDDLKESEKHDNK